MLEKKVAYGSWRKASEAIGLAERQLAKEGTEWTGTCQKCGSVKPAVALAWTRLPFGRGELWACKGGC